MSAEGDTAYLRTRDDYERHSIKLTGHHASGLARAGLRAESQEALERRVKAVEASGLGIGWKDGDPGIGPTYACYDPDGHVMELYYESEWYAGSRPAELSPSLKNQAQAYPGRGHPAAADIALDKGVFIETGPHKHAIQQTFFPYLYEPGGNRIELCNPTGRLIYAPDWKTVTWTAGERAKGQAWGLKTIESFHTHGTPPVGE